MAFNITLAIIGFVLAGDSFGQGFRYLDKKKIIFGIFEMAAGLYFLIAALDTMAGAC